MDCRRALALGECRPAGGAVLVIWYVVQALIVGGIYAAYLLDDPPGVEPQGVLIMAVAIAYAATALPVWLIDWRRRRRERRALLRKFSHSVVAPESRECRPRIGRRSNTSRHHLAKPVDIP